MRSLAEGIGTAGTSRKQRKKPQASHAANVLAKLMAADPVASKLLDPRLGKTWEEQYAGDAPKRQKTFGTTVQGPVKGWLTGPGGKPVPPGPKPGGKKGKATKKRGKVKGKTKAGKKIFPTTPRVRGSIAIPMPATRPKERNPIVRPFRRVGTTKYPVAGDKKHELGNAADALLREHGVPSEYDHVYKQRIIAVLRDPDYKRSQIDAIVSEAKTQDAREAPGLDVPTPASSLLTKTPPRTEAPDSPRTVPKKLPPQTSFVIDLKQDTPRSQTRIPTSKVQHLIQKLEHRPLEDLPFAVTDELPPVPGDLTAPTYTMSEETRSQRGSEKWVFEEGSDVDYNPDDAGTDRDVATSSGISTMDVPREALVLPVPNLAGVQAGMRAVVPRVALIAPPPHTVEHRSNYMRDIYRAMRPSVLNSTNSRAVTYSNNPTSPSMSMSFGSQYKRDRKIVLNGGTILTHGYTATVQCKRRTRSFVAAVTGFLSTEFPHGAKVSGKTYSLVGLIPRVLKGLPGTVKITT